MEHRAYKNEYNSDFLYQIINNRIPGLTATGEESEKVIIIAGELEALQKFAGLMYATPEQIKAAYPEFVTRAEYDAIAKKALVASFNFLRNELVKVSNLAQDTGYGDVSEAASELFNYFAEMREKVNTICK